MTSSSISKIILSGEHSVVYGYPAIALPVNNCNSFVSIEKNLNTNKNIIKAPQISKEISFNLNENKDYISPLEQTVRNFLNLYHLKDDNKKLFITISSQIPIASGMGSGASISSSIVKELAKFFQIDMNKQEIYNLVMEIEKIYHGNPSGVDPMVIVHEKPIFYIKEKTLDFIDIKSNLNIAIIDSGIRSSTKLVVNYVKEQINLYPNKYKNLFEELGKISTEIKEIITSDYKTNIFEIINSNQNLLKEIGISNNELNELEIELKSSGAKAVKISGAGKGGVMLALLTPDITQNFLKSIKEKKIKLVDLLTINP
jgi:mevalonate kinase